MRPGFAFVLILVFGAGEGNARAGFWEDVARSGKVGTGNGNGGGDEWRSAAERTWAGDYEGALDFYERLLADGDFEPAVLANSAELLMALGRLGEAADRYREAVEIEERAPNRRDHVQGLAMGYLGLGVALDRSGRAVASREAIGRALALDPGLGTLELAARSQVAGAKSDLFFVPPGDVFYYLGLARDGQGRDDDAAAAFRDYLRVAPGRYVARARDHLARLAKGRTAFEPGTARLPVTAPPARSDPQSRGLRLRVIHHATLVAMGPLVAPLIDAAWKLEPGLLNDCLSDVVLSDDAAKSTERREFKLSLELRIEDTGRVGSVTARVPEALGPSVALCIETAVRSQFHVSRPAGRKPTRARMELILAPAAPDGL